MLVAALACVVPASRLAAVCNIWGPRITTRGSPFTSLTTLAPGPAPISWCAHPHHSSSSQSPAAIPAHPQPASVESSLLTGSFVLLRARPDRGLHHPSLHFQKKLHTLAAGLTSGSKHQAPTLQRAKKVSNKSFSFSLLAGPWPVVVVAGGHHCLVVDAINARQAPNHHRSWQSSVRFVGPFLSYAPGRHPPPPRLVHTWSCLTPAWRLSGASAHSFYCCSSLLRRFFVLSALSRLPSSLPAVVLSGVRCR